MEWVHSQIWAPVWDAGPEFGTMTRRMSSHFVSSEFKKYRWTQMCHSGVTIPDTLISLRAPAIWLPWPQEERR